MKSTAKRLLSLLLCAVMWFSCLGTAGVTALEGEHEHDHDHVAGEANAAAANETVSAAAETEEVTIALKRDPADGSFDEGQYCLAPTVSVTASDGHVINSVTMNGETVESANYASFRPKGIEGSVKVTVTYDKDKTRELNFSFGHERSGRTDIKYESGSCSVTYQYFYCKRCGSYWGEYRTGGKHNYGEKTIVNSCDGKTYELTECRDCGYVYRREVKDENNGQEKVHTWTKKRTSEAPNCGGFSVTVEECSECHDVNVTVAIGEHTYKDKGEVKDPTCTEQGTRTVTCTKCSEKQTYYVPALGHKFDKGTVTKPADCQNEGVKTYTCERCNATRTETIPVGGHKFADDADCTKGITCKVCGKVVISAKADHNMTYRSDGSTEGHLHYCQNEGCTESAREPHTFTNSVDPKTGKTLVVCSVCGFRSTDHTHEFDNEWTFANGDYHQRKCKTCGVTVTEGHTLEKDDGNCMTARKCTVCGGVAVAARSEHEYTKPVYQDVNGKAPRTDAGHMLQCKYCNAVSEYKTHAPEDDDGDCTTAVTCSVCKWIVVKAKTHVDGEMKSDADGHWFVCGNEGCKQIASEKHEHTVNKDLAAKNCKDPEVCTVCGYVLRAAGVHDLEVTKDNGDGKHHVECRLCDFKDDVAHSFVGDGDCTTADKCVCGAESEPETSHSFGDWKYTDGSTHTRHCKNAGCEKTESENHHGTYTDGDCTKPFECSECKHSLSDGHASHTWEDKPTAEGDKHVYKCTNKGCTVTKSENHVEKVGRYCTDDVVCAICGATIKEGETEHKLVYTTQTQDTDISKKHEIRCENPGCQYKDWKDHESDNANEKDCTKDSVCKDCGYVLVKGVEKHETWKAVVTENGHYKTCTKCGYKTPEESHKAPSYYDCTKEKRCVECGYVMEKALNTEHKLGKPVDDGNGTTHTAKCSYCNYKETNDHTYDPDRKCDEDLACTACGYVKEEAGTHTWGEAVDNKDGTHVYTCEVCGETLSENHSGGKATCTEKAKCAACGAEYGDVDKTNHTGIPIDWTSDGENHWKVCKDCGDRLHVAAHSGGSATCTEKAKCAVCGAEYGEVDKTNHTKLSDKWEFDSENHWKECRACGEKLELAAHTFKDGKCTVCGAVDESYNPPVTTDPSDTTTEPSDTTSEPSDTTKPADTTVPSDTTGEDKPPKTGDSGNNAFLILLAVSVIGVGTVLTVTATSRGKENR